MRSYQFENKAKKTHAETAIDPSHIEKDKTHNGSVLLARSKEIVGSRYARNDELDIEWQRETRAFVINKEPQYSTDGANKSNIFELLEMDDDKDTHRSTRFNSLTKFPK